MKRLVRDGDVVVGYVEGDIFHQRLKPEHLLHSPSAVAKSESVLRDAQRLGAVHYCGTLTSTGEMFVAPLSAFYGPHAFSFDRGYGKQNALPLDAFHTVTVSESSQLGFDWRDFFDEGGSA